MTGQQFVPASATLADYDAAASALQEELSRANEAAFWRLRWEHPRHRGAPIGQVVGSGPTLDDARMVIAREHGFEDWPHVARFVDAMRTDESCVRFEDAADAIVSGDATMLDRLLADHGDLVLARSRRRHRATLLHYIAANGVEGGRQRTPANALVVARILLDAGADVNALADMYDQQCTTMSVLVSSSPPAEAELQGDLAELLLDYGAPFEGPDSKWRSPLHTALVFGFADTAERLARRGAPVTSLPVAAGLGDAQLVRAMLPSASPDERHAALALAAQLGRDEVVRILLDAGEDANRYNPPNYHAHATPLHQAVAAGHLSTVRLLVERGARTDVPDTIYDGTALGWATHLGRREIASLLGSLAGGAQR